MIEQYSKHLLMKTSGFFLGLEKQVLVFWGTYGKFKLCKFLIRFLILVKEIIDC